MFEDLILALDQRLCTQNVYGQHEKRCVPIG